MFSQCFSDQLYDKLIKMLYLLCFVYVCFDFFVCVISDMK